ncbi:uncharacterized protein [Panulirus ornatus]|uniref:uncharacterized protein n=1 Tax=Panulirus ornatus TaxID=150431 RepID=UPI003A868B93
MDASSFRFHLAKNGCLPALSLLMLVEVHVYILPQDKWIPFRRLARNQVVEETVSAGFLRVLPDVNLFDLRREIRGQLSDDLPENFVYIKSVGRNFTQALSAARANGMSQQCYARRMTPFPMRARRNLTVMGHLTQSYVQPKWLY